MSQVQSSVVSSRYPHLQPGLCGRLSCPHICSRVCHCPAGQRRARALLAAQARQRFTVKANRRQEQVCVEVRKAGLCPSLCNKVGGCFLPQWGDTTAELKRKAHRAQQAMDLLIILRERSRPREVTND